MACLSVRWLTAFSYCMQIPVVPFPWPFTRSFYTFFLLSPASLSPSSVSSCTSLLLSLPSSLFQAPFLENCDSITLNYLLLHPLQDSMLLLPFSVAFLHRHCTPSSPTTLTVTWHYPWVFMTRGHLLHNAPLKVEKVSLKPDGNINIYNSIMNMQRLRIETNEPHEN